MTTPHWLYRVCHRLGSAAKNQAVRIRTAQKTGDAGFTVLEALVSFIVFAAVATSASVGIVNALKASHVSQQRVDAADVAQYFISDAIRRASTIPPVAGKTIISNVGGAGTAAGPQVSEGEQFTVVETVQFDAGSCNTGRLFTVNVEVRQAQTNQFLARSDARVACPRA